MGLNRINKVLNRFNSVKCEIRVVMKIDRNQTIFESNQIIPEED